MSKTVGPKGNAKRGIVPASRSTDAESGTYLDFEVEIGGGQGREFPLTVLSSPAGEARETLCFPFDEAVLESRLKSLEIALLRSGGSRRQLLSSEGQAVQDFGRQLFSALFVGEARTRYDMSTEIARHRGLGLRIKLRIQAPELAKLPWEFLYDPRQGEYVCMSRETPIVRYIELPQPIQPLSVQPPLQILGMVSSPSNLPELDIEREKKRLETAIGSLESNGSVKLTWLEGSTWRSLQRAMRGGPWHIFHFIGHGGFDPNVDEGVIALEDDDRAAHLLLATELGRLLADHRTLRLAMLNACEGARGSRHDIFSSTAAVLVRRGIPAVLAMQYAITDRAAIEFSRSFYEALADGLPVDASVCEARKAISLAIANTIEWGTPVLYMRTPQGTIFEMPTEQKVKRLPEQFLAAEADKELQAKLDQSFTDGLAAFWVEDWDRACARFQSILDVRPDYPEAAARLQQSTQQRRLAQLYARALDSQNSQSWSDAITALEELIKDSPDYKDASLLLKAAYKQKRLADLYDEARRLFKASQWQAVIKVLGQVASIDPNYTDQDGLLPASEKEVAAFRRQAELDERYTQAVRAMDARHWEDAQGLFQQLQADEPGYLETGKLLARVESEISGAREQRRRQEQINSLYEQAHGLMRAHQWSKALATLGEIRSLDGQFIDADGITDTAKAELEREEKLTQRQTELSAMYAEASRLLRDEKYQEALEKWAEIHAWDSAFPDRQKVQATARKNLAEQAKVLPVEPPGSRRGLAIAGGLILLVVMMTAGALLYDKANMGKQAALPTPVSNLMPNPAGSTPTQAVIPSAIIPTVPPPPLVGDPTMYDDFNSPGTSLDAGRWETGTTDSGASVVKQDGILKITTDGYGQYVAVSARHFKGIVPGSPMFIETAFKLDPNQNGGTDMSLNIGDRGLVQCQIWGAYGTQNVHCYGNIFDQHKEIITKQIPQGTWHTARIEADPSTMTFSYYVDGLKVGDYTPDRAGELRSARFTVGIGSGCAGSGCADKSTRTVNGYFDYVRVGAIADDPLVYDSFDRPNYDGTYDTSKWEICGSDPGSAVVQESGVLSMTHAGSSGGLKGTALCARKYQGVKISEPTYFEANLRFPDKQMGMLGIYPGTSDSSGTGCFYHYLYTTREYQTMLHCNYVAQGVNWVSRIKDVAPGTWHTVRIEVVPASGDFIYYLDGQKYDSHHAGSNFSQTKFWFVLQVSAESSRDVIGYFDDVKIGPINK